MVKNYFHKGANGTRSSNVTATVCSGKTVRSVQLTICVLIKVVNIPQFKTQTQKFQSVIITLNAWTLTVQHYCSCLYV
jgi:hypothetical protein